MPMVDQIRERRWPITVAALSGLLVVLVVVGETGGGQSPDDAVRADARRVHCLSAKQRPMLVETAIRLDEAAPGSTETAFWPGPTRRGAEPTTLDQWSRDSGEAFSRTCQPLAALTGAKALQDPAPKPPLWQRIATNPVFTLVLGALLTLATTSLTARNARRQLLADQLNTAAAGYLKAADGVRRARLRGKAPDENAFEESRVELWSAILRVPLPAARNRALLARLETAHQTLKEGDFRDEGAVERLRELSTEIADAVRRDGAEAGAPVAAGTRTPGGGR
ncbi:hypothetical protein E1200_15515 [Actinomadura sp. GC306]|uniref:hypothetical protein n=1 Tax=Actinomadura sp. GC306 TaxID=2530367 RepID=UPI00104B40B6|nr:hypothetical protein [Actinomadura sp. GC306]TDC67151.1 hypothetical protein E1200_15515 [Actinomadura sp. GC306]